MIQLIASERRIYESINWTTVGSNNDLLPVRRQAIIWTNVVISLIGPLGTIFSETESKHNNSGILCI